MDGPGFSETVSVKVRNTVAGDDSSPANKIELVPLD
jgi:hypothetical protein